MTPLKKTGPERVFPTSGPSDLILRLLFWRGSVRSTSIGRLRRFRFFPKEDRLDDTEGVSAHLPRHCLPILLQQSFEVLLIRGDVRLLFSV